jgi:hypothetical protein
MARLDDIVGPQGWTAELTSTERGFKCRIKIICPDETPEGWAWHFKEDVGGREDMGFKDKTTGEWEADVDNDEKSASTNAFRRAAAQWGFGRELYNEGVPRWMADLFPKSMIVTSPSEPILAPSTVPQDRQVPAPQPGRATAAIAPPQQPPQHNGQRELRIDPPTTAKSVYPWLMNIQKKFGISPVEAVNDFCRENFGTWDTRKLGDQQVILLSTWVIEQVKGWHNYDGCFDTRGTVVGHDKLAVLTGSEPTTATQAVVQAHLNDTSRSPRGNLKRAIVASVRSLLQQQTGREANEQQVQTCIGELAAHAKNGAGVTGEVLTSLKAVDDDEWLTNILLKCHEHLERNTAVVPATVPRSDDEEDIPF